MDNTKAYTGDYQMRLLVKQHNALILVMGRFGISLGVGDKTVEEICQEHKVDLQTFLQVANYVAGKPYHWEKVSLPSLIGYLKEAHEYYLNFNLPNIRRKLLEAIDCSVANDLSMLILRFYDEYVAEVRKHMEYENEVVFAYVDQLSQGLLDQHYTIASFAGKHAPIGYKLKELKDIIIRYYPEKNNYLLNAVLLDIIACEQDLTSHCLIEDRLFVPAVKQVEQQIKESGKEVYANEEESASADKEKIETLSKREIDIIVCITKGMSTKEIAEKLFLSIHTVNTHRRNISAKLQIHSTAGLTIYAIANKLISLEDVE